jgi:hypothetical protein
VPGRPNPCHSDASERQRARRNLLCEAAQSLSFRRPRALASQEESAPCRPSNEAEPLPFRRQRALASQRNLLFADFQQPTAVLDGLVCAAYMFKSFPKSLHTISGKGYIRMNAERLHAIVKALKVEMDGKNILPLLQNLINGLRSVVQQANAANQQNLANNRANLFQALADSPSDHFSPSWRQLLREIGGEELFGATLRQKIENTLAANQMTPTVAADELERLRQQMDRFLNALKQCDSGLSTFGISDEKLEPGACEIGMLIPRGEVDNKLIDFANELRELSLILNHFSEVATGAPDNLDIKTISSSDLLVYLNAGIPLGACVAVAIERIVALYKNLLEIRKLQTDIRNQGIPDDATKGIEEYANTHMTRGIEGLSVEIVNEFYQGNDSGRKNELIAAMHISLNKIANRIDHGYNIEVRCEPPAPKDAAAQSEETKNAVAQVLAASANMQFLKLDGKPLLGLPEAPTRTRPGQAIGGRGGRGAKKGTAPSEVKA